MKKLIIGLMLTLASLAAFSQTQTYFRITSTSHDFYAAGSPYKVSLANSDGQGTEYVIKSTAGGSVTLQFDPWYGLSAGSEWYPDGGWSQGQYAWIWGVYANGSNSQLLSGTDQLVTSWGTLTPTNQNITNVHVNPGSNTFTVNGNTSTTRDLMVCVQFDDPKYNTGANPLVTYNLYTSYWGLTRARVCLKMMKAIPPPVTITKSIVGTGIPNVYYMKNNSGTWVSWTTSTLSVSPLDTYKFRGQFQSNQSGYKADFTISGVGGSASVLNVPYPSGQFVQTTTDVNITAAGTVKFQNSKHP